MAASDETLQLLASITDSGKFEKLATAVIRLGDPFYRSLGHTGVNAQGKTVKSPVDCLGFVRGAEPPHMVTAQHTASERDKLERKWLHDPSTVKPRNATGRPTAPPGDLVKTIELAAQQVREMPGLKTTLALTCNVEPPQDLVRGVVAEGLRHGISVDVWSASRIAGILDDDADGQWLRYQFLGMRQERLSSDLLRKLAQAEADRHDPLDDAEKRIDRELDDALAGAVQARAVTLFVAAAGLGKSVACHKLLLRHLQEGGYGLILPHDVIEGAAGVEDAIETTLRRAAPELAPGCGAAALALASPTAPFLLVVEDVNRAVRPEAILERLTAWIPASATGDAGSGPMVPWRLVCPCWQRWIDRLPDNTRRRMDVAILMGGVFRPDESAEALSRRAEGGRTILPLEAERLSAALGHDPLLIGLHEPGAEANPAGVIASWIGTSVRRLAAGEGAFAAPDYAAALERLAQAMLSRRKFAPDWRDVVAWFPGPANETLAILRSLVRHAEVLRLGSAQELLFRHDRVRDEVLTAAATAMMVSGDLHDDLWSEPSVADVLGRALARAGASDTHVANARALSPLALFHAFAALGTSHAGERTRVLRAIKDWLAEPETQGRAHSHCRWAAIRVLADVEDPEVLILLALFDTKTEEALQAAFRNGDLVAGYDLCLRSPPGLSDPWRDRQIAHAAGRFRGGLATSLDVSLRNADAEPWERIAALRLAGFIGDPALAEAVATCWKSDSERERHLRDHLWAATRCCDDDPDRLLRAPCDVWAGMSDVVAPGDLVSDRDDVAVYDLAFAVRETGLPAQALRYLGDRAAAGPTLRRQIATLLHDVDHPEVAVIVAKVRASLATEDEVAIRPYVLGRRSGADWIIAFRDDTRAALEALWTNPDEPDNLRHAAFEVWEAGRGRRDLAILSAVTQYDSLADAAMAARLRRGDHGAEPALMTKIRGVRSAYWWQIGREIWSESLTLALDADIERRTGAGADAEPEEFWDVIVPELLSRLPAREAEQILEKHWDRVSSRPAFVGVALFLATSRLAARVDAILKSSPEPGRLLKWLGVTFTRVGHPKGVTARRQIDGVLPYLEHLERSSRVIFRNICAGHGWDDLRRLIDASLPVEERLSGVFDESAFCERLDGMAGTINAIWLSKILDDSTGKTSDATLNRLLRAVLDWAEARSTIEALELAAAAVCHAGGPADAARLTSIAQAMRGTPDAEAVAIDTRFAVGLKGRA